MASETCPRCGREKAESYDAWLNAPVPTEADRSFRSTCAWHMDEETDPERYRAWDCDVAHIARLERELAEARKLTPPELFPIMGGPAIPWAMIAPHEAQAQLNHYQTLRRLAERGGLSPCEAVAVLEDRRWHEMTDARDRLVALVKAYTDEPLRRELAEAKGRVAAIGELLAANGCDCECAHGQFDHEIGCERCLGCRISGVLTPAPST